MKMDNMNNQQYKAPGPDSQDGGNKALAALSYFTWIVALIAFFVKKDDSPFVKFHAIQGIAFTIVKYVVSAIIGALGFILGIIFGIFDSIVGANGGFVSLATLLTSGLGGLVGLGALVFMVLGIVNAVQGTMKPLPLFGQKVDEKFNK